MSVLADHMGNTGLWISASYFSKYSIGIKLEEEVNQIAEIIAQRPLDGIVMGKKEFLLAMDIMGLSAGYDLASLHHNLISNTKFGPGEFNLMKELRDKGRKGMYAARDEHYKAAQLQKK